MIQLTAFPMFALIDAEAIASPLVGFIVVMLALTVIWILLECQGAFFRRLDGNVVEEVYEPEPKAGKDFPDELSPEMVAIVTAAVHSAMGGPARIVSIRSARDSSWSEEGRRSIYSSHRIR